MTTVEDIVRQTMAHIGGKILHEDDLDDLCTGCGADEGAMHVDECPVLADHRADCGHEVDCNVFQGSPFGRRDCSCRAKADPVLARELLSVTRQMIDAGQFASKPGMQPAMINGKPLTRPDGTPLRIGDLETGIAFEVEMGSGGGAASRAVILRHSDDGGQTWQPPYAMWDRMKAETRKRKRPRISISYDQHDWNYSFIHQTCNVCDATEAEVLDNVVTKCVPINRKVSADIARAFAMGHSDDHADRLTPARRAGLD